LTGECEGRRLALARPYLNNEREREREGECETWIETRVYALNKNPTGHGRPV